MKQALPLAALAAAFLMLSAVAPAAPAAAQEDIWSRTINDDTHGVWNVMPDRPRPRRVDVADIPGGSALRISARAGPNPWAVQATSPINGEIAQGDVIMLVLYARAETPAEGGSSLPIYIQLAAAPYTSALSANKAITGEWAQYCTYGVASADMPGGGTNVTVHLGTATQVVELGPVFVFNLGADYDASQLDGACAR